MILLSFLIIIILLVWAWGSLAIYIAGPDSIVLRYGILLTFIITLPASFYFSHGFSPAIVPLSIVFASLLIWWNRLIPDNNKNWADDVANIPYGTIKDNILTLHNVRNFDYQSKTQFTERWETRTYDLSQLTSLDLFVSYWGSPHIAHTIMSWGFANNEQLAVSIETRKDKSQRYSALKGFFKQYTLAYVAADERDVIRLRTNYRKEDVYIYRLTGISISKIRAFLESYVSHMNQLINKPEFYHALTKNCTSAIRLHNETDPDRIPFDWRLIANGHVDELLYKHNVIRHDLPFEELRKRSRIDIKTQKSDSKNFAVQIRKDAGIN